MDISYPKISRRCIQDQIQSSSRGSDAHWHKEHSIVLDIIFLNLLEFVVRGLFSHYVVKANSTANRLVSEGPASLVNSSTDRIGAISGGVQTVFAYQMHIGLDPRFAVVWIFNEEELGCHDDTSRVFVRSSELGRRLIFKMMME